jgi:predicted ATPase
MRREIHARIAATLEKQFSDVVESQPELLKHHYGNAGVHAKAVDYALRAGRRAAQRSADRDAEQHLNEGLRWLENLEQSSSRKMTELDIRSSLAGVLMTTKGYAAPEVEQILERTVPLIAELGDKPELFGMRWFRWSFLLNRARHEEALQLALENLEVARASGHRENQVVAHMALGGGSFYAMGRGSEAMRELEAAVALYDPERFRNHIVNFGQEPGATMLLQLALVRSGLGYMDQAMVADRRAMEVAQHSQNIHSQCLALALHELHMQQRGDREEIKRSFAQLATLCQQHAVPFWELFGRIIFDWSRVAEEPTAIDRMRADFRTLKMSGSRLLATRWYYMLADACLTLGRHEEGLADVKEAMDFMEQTNERWFQADLERVEGALHLSVGHEVAAEASLLKSLETARRQGSKTRELQAAMVLSHLLQRRGQPQMARDLLGPLCEWFKEGADIFYIQQARKLLAQLA